ncbi:MAG: VanW family protein [Peptoniphilus harei]|nr:VanW family protein [Peptoniphilus harei]MDU5466513.1 VanW family protein [Peptoniphilus harei]
MENLGNKILNINKKILITLALILMLIFISVMYFTEEYTNPYMHKGVKIEDIDVSNLSKEDALKEVKSVTDEMIKNKVVNFTYEDISIPVPLRDFGYKLNLEDAINKAYSYGRSDNLFYNYLDIIKGYIFKKNFVAKPDIEDAKREEVILNIGNKIFKKALDAYPIINEDGSVTIKDSEIGRYMDINEAKDLINLDILHEDKIELPVYKTEPKIYSNYYDGINKKLGDFETDYSSSVKNRKENIRLAASKFNNMKLNPGDEISFNDVVGEISEKTGFKSATVIVGGEYESGIGGGICQVSTTLYNSLILSDLEITERHNHSRPIHYVDLGTDAAVARGYKDLKFKNNTNNPILILSEANGEKLNFKVLGNGSDRDYEVKIIPQLLGTVSPGVDTIYSDALPEGESTVRESGARGYSYKTYKEIIKNGEVVEKKEISKSYYLPKDKVVVVGTGTTNDDDSENNDED